MAFTAGTNNIKIFSIESIVIVYTLPAGTENTATLLPENIEQGVNIAQSVNNSVVMSDGAEIPRSEKLAISFTAMGTGAEMTLWKNIINKLESVSLGLVYFKINKDDGTYFQIFNPEMNASGIAKGGEITKLLISLEISCSDVDQIMTWEV